MLTTDERRALADSLFATQNADGGWTLSRLGDWKRSDGTMLDTLSDGYATGLVTFVLRRAGYESNEARLASALAWLAAHQDSATGKWTATSLNRRRDPATAAANFMSDAATEFAILALTYRTP